MRRAGADSLSPIPLTHPALLASLVSLAVGSLFFAVAAPAQASQLIDRDATHVRLAVNPRGQALLTYRVGSLTRHVLGWGALNARPSGAGGSQVSFRLDYSGGWGTYHFTAGGAVTWHGFAEAIFALAAPWRGPAPLVRAITTADYPTPARRPANSVLDCSRIGAAFGIVPRGWREALAEVIRELGEGVTGP